MKMPQPLLRWGMRILAYSLMGILLAHVGNRAIMLDDNFGQDTFIKVAIGFLVAATWMLWPRRPAALKGVERRDIAAAALLLVGLYLLDREGGPVLILPDSERFKRYFQLEIRRLEDLVIGTAFVVAGGAALVRRCRVSISLTATPVVTVLARPFSGLRLASTSLLAVGLCASGGIGIALYRGAYEPWMAGGVGIAAIAAIVGGFALDRDAGPRERRTAFGWVDAGILLAATIVSIAVACGVVARNGAVVFGDEGAFWEMAQSIIDGQRPNPFGLGVYTFPVASNYAQAAIMAVVGDDFAGWRTSSAIVYATAVIPVYVVARAASGRLFACCASIALITLPYGLAYARLGYNNSQAIPIVAATIACGWFAYERRSHGAMALAGVFAGLGFFTYTGARLGVVAAAMVAVIAAVGIIRGPGAVRSRLADLSRLIRSNVVFAAAFLTTVLPSFLYQLRWVDRDQANGKLVEGLFFEGFYGRSRFPEAELFRDHPPLDFGSGDGFFRIDLWFRLIGRGFFYFWNFTYSLDNRIEHLVATSYAGPAIGLLAFLLGISLAIRARGTHLGIWLLVTLGSGAAMLSILNSFPPRPAHFVPVVPAIALLVGWGSAAVIRRIAPPERSAWRLVASSAIVLGMLAFTSLRIVIVETPKRFSPYPYEALLLDSATANSPSRWTFVSSNRYPPDVRFWSERLRNVQEIATVQPRNLLPYIDSLRPGEHMTIYWQTEDHAQVWPVLAQRSIANTDLQVYTEATGVVTGYSIVVAVGG